MKTLSEGFDEGYPTFQRFCKNIAEPPAVVKQLIKISMVGNAAGQSGKGGQGQGDWDQLWRSSYGLGIHEFGSSVST